MIGKQKNSRNQKNPPRSKRSFSEEFSPQVFLRAPLSFFGIGIYRAWIELAFVRPIDEIAAVGFQTHDIFDVAMIVVLFAMAFLARRLTPLYQKTVTLVTGCCGMILGTALLCLTFFEPSWYAYLYIPASIIAGAGTAVVILLWSELYGCINPLRVAFYYSGSILLAAALIALFNGFVSELRMMLLVLLPILSFMLVFNCYRNIPERNLPRDNWGNYSFPWKPTLLMAVYGFAYGLREAAAYETVGPHSSLGTVIAALIVFLGVIFMSKRFDFKITYRIALPLMVSGLLLVSLVPQVGWLANTFVAMSYTSFSILMMLMLSNITYRLWISAVWLFGIERGLRAFSQLIGRYTTESLTLGIMPEATAGAIITVVTVVLVVIATMILLSEKELSSQWGVIFLKNNTEDSAGEEQTRLATLCSEISKRYRLSPREEEVLLLLAQRQKPEGIEKELFIAKGTVKAHIQHIYRKLGINSRKELHDILSVNEEEPALTNELAE